MKGSSVHHLNEDLLWEIFLRLPVKSLTRLKCVSKPWSDLISSPEFVKRHLNHSAERDSGCGLVLWGDASLRSFDFRNPEHLAAEVDHPDCIKSLVKNDVFLRFDYDHPTSYCPHPPEIVGSCNGLLCISRSDSEFFILYNPATRVYKQVPRPNSNYDILIDTYNHLGGFGYDRVGDDYKILTLTTYFEGPPYRDVVKATRLYSLKANEWQDIENPSFDPGIMLGGRCVTANNSLYLPASNDTNRMILRFDLSTHRFEVIIPFPEKSRCFRRLAALRGLLHLMTVDAHIWVLRNDLWTKLFHCSSAQYETLDPSFHLNRRSKPIRSKSQWPLPFAYSKDGRKILIGIDQKPKRFICFDLESQSTSEIEFSGFPQEPTLASEPWFESLVPLV